MNKLNNSMVILLFFAFLSGLLTILAPCIWPLLPVVLSTSTTGKKRRPIGITIGIVLSFAILTLFLSYIVQLIPFNTNILRSLAAVFIIFLGFTLVIPQLNIFVESFISRIAAIAADKKPVEDNGFGSGVIIGISIGIVWTPCAGPILATIASLAGTQQVGVQIILVTIAYAIGTAIPLFFFATLGSQIIEKSRWVGRYLGVIQKVFGIFVILIGIAIIFHYDSFVEAKLLSDIPSYQHILNYIEGNPAVTSELHQLQHTQSGDTSTAPDFIGITKWLNTSKPIHISDLKGKVVLVDFWTYTCINCIRTLPHVTHWYNTYKQDGLVVIGIHTPEFQFEHDTSNVEQAIAQDGITYPVGQDNNYATWNNYNNEYWPAEYLIDANGVIRKTDFGEGNYDDMEHAIRQLLMLNGATLSQDTQAVTDQTPTTQLTPETYLGSNRGNAIVSDESIANGTYSFSSSQTPDINTFKYTGTMTISNDYITPHAGSSLDLHFYASKVYLVITPGSKNANTIDVKLDGKPIPVSDAGTDIIDGYINLDTERLYNIVDLHGKAGNHLLHLDFLSDKNNVYVFTFG